MNRAYIIDDQYHKNLEEEKLIIADLERSTIVQCYGLYSYKPEPLVLQETSSRMSSKHLNKDRFASKDISKFELGTENIEMVISRKLENSITVRTGEVYQKGTVSLVYFKSILCPS